MPLPLCSSAPRLVRQLPVSWVPTYRPFPRGLPVSRTLAPRTQRPASPGPHYSPHPSSPSSSGVMQRGEAAGVPALHQAAGSGARSGGAGDLRAQAAVGEGSAVRGARGARLDSHLHVWASPEESPRFPYFPGQEPAVLGSAACLLQEMEAAGVLGAVIIQPINHKFDHSYVSSVLRAHPGRFVGCCLANPAPDGSGVPELRRLLGEEGYRAVRFNPYLWPPGERMSNSVGQALFQAAGEFRAPVGFMCFKGLLLHLADIRELCVLHPGTPVILDHFGFCKSPYDPDHSTEADKEAWAGLLSLAQLPQVHIKCSAFFRVSRQPFPYRDTWPLVLELLRAFGPRRLMWGSDFPFVVEQCGYKQAWDILPEEFGVSEEDRDWLFGGTVKSLFAGDFAAS